MGGAATSFDCALAQITPDATLGAERSVVTPTNIYGLPSDRIDGGAQRGANLFHSFREFNVDSGRGAYFANPAGIENIISRVTGSNASNIFGKLGVLGNANLFLINPNGIIFGPNASLDVGGSFVASTASSLKFADGTEFSATAPQTIPLLTIRMPIGLQFGGNPGSILNQSQATDGNGNPVGLQVQPGRTLALVGGDVALLGGSLTAQGYMTAVGGRIELGSVAGPSSVGLTHIDKGWSLGYEGVSTFGDIQISGAGVVASGVGGGDIQVRASQVALTNGSHIEDNNNPPSTVANAQGSETGGTVNVTAADSVQVIGGSRIFARPFSDGAGGNLNIATGKLLVSGESYISTSNFHGQGRAGNLSVNAPDSVQVMGPPPADQKSSLSTDTYTSGAGGNLTITTGKLLLSDEGNLTANVYDRGQGGNLSVNASSVELIGSSLRAQTYGDGAGGNLTIATGKLLVSGGSDISTTTYDQRGRAGNLSVNASDSVQVMGTSADGQTPSGLFADSRGAGAAGDLTISTGKLIVLNGLSGAENSRAVWLGESDYLGELNPTV